MTHDPARAPGASAGTDDLQFDRAEAVAPPPPPPGGNGTVTQSAAPPVAPGVSACAACNQPITDVYFEANGKVVCPQCHHAITTSQVGGSAFGRLLKATALGFFAGAVGAAIWYGVRVSTGSEWGIIAIGVGLLVGGAVRYGSGGRGGRGYQFLAVLLTYIAICANYVPDIYRGVLSGEDEVPKVAALIFAMVFSLGVPFMAGASNIIGLLIIGFALWEAWRINQRQQVTFNGPYRLAPGGMPASPGMPVWSGMPGPSPTAPPPMPAWPGAAPPVPASAAQMPSQQSAPPPPPPNLGL